MMDDAGKLKIPFTTGLLLGIGETVADREESLVAIRDIHRKYGHIQEIILQNFCPKDNTPMAAFRVPETGRSARRSAWHAVSCRREIAIQIAAEPHRRIAAHRVRGRRSGRYFPGHRRLCEPRNILGRRLKTSKRSWVARRSANASASTPGSSAWAGISPACNP